MLFVRRGCRPFSPGVWLSSQEGIRRGDRVLVMLPRVPAWWIEMLGLIRLGAVPIPATTLLTAKDIAYRVQAAGITAILTDADEGRPRRLASAAS